MGGLTLLAKTAFLFLSIFLAAVPLARRSDDTSFGSIATDPPTRECGLAPTIVLSELNVQLYVVPTIAGGGLLPLANHTITVTSAKRREWTRQTDQQGFARFPELPTGTYRLDVEYVIEPLSRQVRITNYRSGRPQTIAAIANITCGRVCVVPSTGRALDAPPKCLVLRGGQNQ